MCKCEYLYIRDHVFIIDMRIVKYERYLVILRGFPYSLRSYCVTYLYWSCAPRLHFTHGVYFCYFMIYVIILVRNIRYHSSRSWGFVVASETPWNFLYNYFSMTFQKEPLGGYLVYGSRYVGFKFQLLRPYNFIYIACVR
jgi:hypothetical protein